MPHGNLCLYYARTIRYYMSHYEACIHKYVFIEYRRYFHCIFKQRNYLNSILIKIHCCVVEPLLATQTVLVQCSLGHRKFYCLFHFYFSQFFSHPRNFSFTTNEANTDAEISAKRAIHAVALKFYWLSLGELGSGKFWLALVRVSPKRNIFFTSKSEWSLQCLQTYGRSRGQPCPVASSIAGPSSAGFARTGTKQSPPLQFE